MYKTEALNHGFRKFYSKWWEETVALCSATSQEAEHPPVRFSFLMPIYVKFRLVWKASSIGTGMTKNKVTTIGTLQGMLLR